MTIKEAILKSLEELNKLVSSPEVCKHITTNNYYDFGTTKVPGATISAQLGNFIREGDSRVKRIKTDAKNVEYLYYLAKNEENINLENLENSLKNINNSEEVNKSKSYKERDLHKLLSTYLKNAKIYSKTIFHEQSKSNNDSNQKWIHPDMVGINFLNLQSKESQIFLKSINRIDTFKLNSYELKREINNDYELKQAFFQAVSNSSWANYGYLVAFEFSDNLMEEMERLNQSFGIGIIKLRANPYQSKVLFPAKYHDLDFKTIDKLCRINSEFAKFIEQTEKLMTAEERYYNATEKEFDEFCDDYFENDIEIENYCKEHNIPIEEE